MTMKEKAVIVTNGLLDSPFAKTCHGLLRGTERFEILGVVDNEHAGKDSGMVMENKANGILVFASITDFLKQVAEVPVYCIVGVATPGGYLPEAMRKELLSGLKNGMSLVNGLHTFLNDDPEFSELAGQLGLKIIDVRKPKPRSELKFWSGKIYEVKIPKIAVLGTDCAIGKRTTCRFITQMCKENGINTEMIYTGQTGWMQGSKHGFVFDSTINDFISGEIESAIVECATQSNPDLILIEGQSALLNPTGPCGSEFILSGNVKGVVLQHVPGRKHYEDTHVPLSPIEKEIQLIRLLGAEVLAVTLNGEGLSETELIQSQEYLSQQLGIPVIRPLQEGVSGLLPVIKAFMASQE